MSWQTKYLFGSALLFVAGFLYMIVLGFVVGFDTVPTFIQKLPLIVVSGNMVIAMLVALLTSILSGTNGERWDDLTRFEKTVVYINHQRWMLLLWLNVPVVFPNWLLYTICYKVMLRGSGYTREFHWLALRANWPSVLNGAALWYCIYSFVAYLVRSWL